VELSFPLVGIRVRVNDLTLDSDEDLLRRSAAGDEQAFTTLYRRRQAAIYRFALNMSGREEVAEEVTQDVFLTLIREPLRFDPERGTVCSFLFGIARNFVLRVVERDRSFVTMDDEDSFAPEAADTDVLSHLTRNEAVELVRQAVLSLPTVYREVVVLCDLEEISYAEAASVLGVPVGTVRSRLNRGRALLTEKLRGRGEGRNAMRCSTW